MAASSAPGSGLQGVGAATCGQREAVEQRLARRGAVPRGPLRSAEVDQHAGVLECSLEGDIDLCGFLGIDEGSDPASRRSASASA
jgi:hypothetical protein